MTRFRRIVGQHLDEALCRRIVSEMIPRGPEAEVRCGQTLRADGDMV